MSNRLFVYYPFLQFRNVMIDAIELAWNDGVFHQLLIDSHEHALKKHFNYEHPFDRDMGSTPYDDAIYRMRNRLAIYDLYDHFLRFRDVMIEAIDLAQREKRFHRFLIDKPEQALQEYFGYEHPFDMDIQSKPVYGMHNRSAVYDRFLQFRAVIIQAIALAWQYDDFRELLIYDPKRALKDCFGYDFPFDIEMKSNPDNAAWKPDTVVDWQVSKLNELQMVLPPKPKNKADEPYALADYNTNHLTFLSN